MDGILVREPVDGDTPHLARLITELGYPTTTAQMGRRIAAINADPDHATFVAARDRNPVGLVGALINLSYDHDAPVGRIIGLVVAHSERNSGIGKQLVARAEAGFANGVHA